VLRRNRKGRKSSDVAVDTAHTPTATDLLPGGQAGDLQGLPTLEELDARDSRQGIRTVRNRRQREWVGHWLAFSRQTVLDHGGDMWIDPAAGARCVIRFPLNGGEGF
jgi:hypothetical protein